jgi:sporulation protein YlmC with PRC-barrel domain
MGEILVGFDLLDRQIIDVAGASVGKVDDVELTIDPRDPTGAPRVTALLVGPQALGRRLGGRLGHWISTVAGMLHPAEHPDPLRIAWDLVAERQHPVETDNAVRLTIRRELLTEPALEIWLREHVIEHIPGADRAGD